MTAAPRERAQRSWAAWSTLVGLVLLALALRLLRLDGVALRGDEAFTIQYWPLGWSAALDLVGTDPHPWGAYALIAVWRSIFGDGVWIMRLLPALLSVIGVAGTYQLSRALFASRRVAAIAALFYAIHPFLIWHAQDVRNYAIWAALSPLSAWAFLLALRHNQRRDWALYVITSAASAYVFFLHPFLIAAQALYLILARRDRLRPWLVAMLVMALLLVPWGAQLLAATNSDYGGTAGRFAPQELVTWFLPVLTIGNTLDADLFAPLGVALAVIVLIALVLLWRWQPQSTLFLAAHLLVPAAILSIIALRMAVFRPRYIIAIVPFLLVLLVSLVVDLTTRKHVTGVIGLAGLLVLGMFNGAALLNHYANPAFYKAPDWPPLGTFLTEWTQPGDLVVQQAQDPAFTYYFRGPADETTLPGSPNAPAEETIAILQEAIETRRAVWLIPAEIPGFDDERVPLTWLTGHTQTTLDVTISDFRVLEYRSWRVIQDEYTEQYSYDFDGIAHLIDWQVDRPTPDRLRIILYWQPTGQTGNPLAGFVHLVGPPNPVDGSPLWTQDDHPVPAGAVAPGGTMDSTSWPPDEVRRDVYQLDLPPDLPAVGPWSLHIGLYDPATLDRLLITTTGADYLEIPLDANLAPMASQ